VTESSEAAIRTIFCAHDFSDTAKLALEQALRIARRHGARLVLAHIVEPIPLGPYPAVMAPQNDLAIRDLAAKRLGELAASIRTDALEVESRVHLGQPGPQLIAAAEDEGADLFVIGTRGLTGFKHLLLGSTAEYVVRRSACPVLTVHPGDSVVRETIDTVLLPTDLSPGAARAAEAFVALFAGIERPRIILAYADHTPPYFEPFRHETLLRTNQPDAVKEAIEERMQPSVELLEAAGFEVETAVLDGDPVPVMTALARDRDVDLIVLSTHGRSAFVNMLLGRTAQRIVQHAPSPVLTAHPRERHDAR
jgi:universal stress protein A